MTAFEANKLMHKARAAADMPVVYKQIKEAAENGKDCLFLSKRDVTETQIEILKTKGYKITDYLQEQNSMQTSDIKIGW